MGMQQPKSEIDSVWYQSIWLPFAAGTYIVICIFDFMIMPIYTAAHNSRIENKVFIQLEGKDAATFADGIIKANQAQRQWNPLTLLGAGMFHLAFGALLTGGAVTRGMAKRSEIDGYYKYGSAGYDAPYGGEYGGGYGNPQQQYPSGNVQQPYPGYGALPSNQYPAYSGQPTSRPGQPQDYENTVYRENQPGRGRQERVRNDQLPKEHIPARPPAPPLGGHPDGPMPRTDQIDPSD